MKQLIFQYLDYILDHSKIYFYDGSYFVLDNITNRKYFELVGGGKTQIVSYKLLDEISNIFSIEKVDTPTTKVRGILGLPP